MPAILSKNCIVGGELDWYCLACCVLLPAAEDAMAHIQAAAHKHNLTELPYANKYEEDFIRKARGVYYCEVCNMTFPTAAKVGMHITEATHVAGKTGRQLKPAGTAIVFQENTLITESAWNGLVDDTCVLCNVEFDDESTHKSQQNHILNLINSSVTAAAHAANYIYRKIDDGYQCLTCNKVVPEGGITEHLDSEQHKSAFISYDQNEVNDVKGNDVADKESKDGDTAANTGGKSLCTNHVLNKSACSSDVKEVETLAKQHGLSVNKGSSGVYCSACSVYVTATLDRINEHVDGKKHKGNLAKQPQAKKLIVKNIKKTPENQFVVDKTVTLNVFTREGFILVNNIFFLKIHIFSGIADVNDKKICLFCDKILSNTNMLLKEHVEWPSHQNGMSKASVISSLEDEFIREFREDLYQCVYCGSLKNNLDDMLDHLNTAEHKRCKDDSRAQMMVYKSQKDKYEEMLFGVLLGSPMPTYVDLMDWNDEEKFLSIINA